MNAAFDARAFAATLPRRPGVYRMYGVDGELLRQCSVGCEEDSSAATPLYELANGCLCCTVQEEFVPVLQTLVERRERIDHVLIETSGLALPKPLVQAFQWPEIRANCTVDAVVALVDGPAVLSGQFAEDPAAVEQQRREDPSLDHERPLQELFEDQLAAADLVIVSKVDELGPGGFEQVRAQIASLTPPNVKVIAAERGVLPLDVVLGRLNDGQIPAGKIYDVADIAEDPHYQARGMILDGALPDGTPVKLPGIVPKLSASPGGQWRNAPALGQDSEAVLREVGLTEAQIAALRARGVVQ